MKIQLCIALLLSTVVSLSNGQTSFNPFSFLSTAFGGGGGGQSNNLGGIFDIYRNLPNFYGSLPYGLGSQSAGNEIYQNQPTQNSYQNYREAPRQNYQNNRAYQPATYQNNQNYRENYRNYRRPYQSSSFNSIQNPGRGSTNNVIGNKVYNSDGGPINSVINSP